MRFTMRFLLMSWLLKHTWLDLEKLVKAGWALAHLNQFVGVMDAPLEILLSAYIIGPTGTLKELCCRKTVSPHL